MIQYYLFAGVTTIAGGKWGRGGGHVDGPSEDAKFSNDFDLVYIGSSCSLLVIDRGNQAIREIQLNDDDCSYDYDGSFHLGIRKKSTLPYVIFISRSQRCVRCVLILQGQQCLLQLHFLATCQRCCSKGCEQCFLPNM